MNITRVIAVHKHKEMVSLSLFMEIVSLSIFMAIFIFTAVSCRCLPTANKGASAILPFEIRRIQSVMEQSVAGELKGDTVPENRLVSLYANRGSRFHPSMEGFSTIYKSSIFERHRS